jgi:hypothetical protein
MAAVCAHAGTAPSDHFYMSLVMLAIGSKDLAVAETRRQDVRWQFITNALPHCPRSEGANVSATSRTAPGSRIARRIRTPARMSLRSNSTDRVEQSDRLPLWRTTMDARHRGRCGRMRAQWQARDLRRRSLSASPPTEQWG